MFGVMEWQLIEQQGLEVETNKYGIVNLTKNMVQYRAEWRSFFFSLHNNLFTFSYCHKNVTS